MVSIAPSDCHARLLPSEKLTWIYDLQKPEGNAGGVIMLGDGINGRSYHLLIQHTNMARFRYRDLGLLLMDTHTFIISHFINENKNSKSNIGIL